MRADDTETHARIVSIVYSFRPRGCDVQDLLQEATIHFERQVTHNPGQTESFYLHGCWCFLKDYIRIGRSIDSPKRAASAIQIEEAVGDGSGSCPVWCIDVEDPIGNACANELVDALSLRLKPPRVEILQRLAQGHSSSEIAKAMGMAHPSIVRHRQHIAALATQLGFGVGR